MGVSSISEPDDVLEPFHQSSEAHTKLMLHVIWWIVSQNDSNTTIYFHFKELRLQPSKHITWILSFSINVPVQAVTSLGIDCNYFRSFWEFFSILKFHVHAVVPILWKLFHCLFIEPVIPVFHKWVDFIINTGRIEVLHLFNPSIVVALNGEYGNATILKGLLYHVGHGDCVDGCLISSIIPHIVCSIVASPKYNIRFQVLGNEA